MAKQVTDFVVRKNGSIDLDATLDKFASELDAFLKQEELINGQVKDYIYTVFDKFRGCRFNIASLTSFTLKEMGADPDRYPVLSEAIHTFIKRNTGTRESGALIKVSRGKAKQGNVRLWRDVPMYDTEE